MAEHIDVVKEWVESFREDIETVKAVCDAEAIDEDARKFAASALNYLVSRLDLVPDWNDTIGVIDDVMVLRICLNLASVYGLDDLPTDAMVGAMKMSNDAERIEAFLGEDLFARFKKHCARLVDESVRGRNADKIIGDAEERAKLYEEVEEDLKKMPAAKFEDAEQVELKLKSYLHAKLAD